MISDDFVRMHRFYSLDKCQHREHRYGSEYYHVWQIDELYRENTHPVNMHGARVAYYAAAVLITALRRQLRSGPPV